MPGKKRATGKKNKPVRRKHAAKKRANGRARKKLKLKQRIKRRRGPTKKTRQKEKRLVKKVERAAKKKGFSLFTWLRRGRVAPKKKPSAYLQERHLELQKQRIIAPEEKKLPTNAVVISAPKVQEPESPPNPQILPAYSGEAVQQQTEAPQQPEKHFIVETAMRNPILRTDFDSILRLVDEEGFISAGKVKSKLRLDGRSLKECYLELEKAGKIRVEYPLFGPPRLVSVEFEKEKKRQALIKRGIRPQEDYEEEEGK